MKIKPLYICISGFLLFIIIFITIFLTIDTKNVKQETIVTISEGNGTKQIAFKLKAAGIVKSKLAFTYFIKKSGLTAKLKPGIYKFEPGKVTFKDVSDKLIKGTQVDYVSVTIPEGYKVEQIAALLEEKGLVKKDDFLKCASNIELPYDYIKKIADYRRLEGFLYPNTYNIPITWKETEIINMLIKQFDKVWTDEYDLRAKELGFSVNDIITIASLIERESKIDNERSIISSVIHNRLKKGMLLQIDATVQYLLPKQKARLLYKDLEIDSPYNTYKYQGLPPTAISVPGEKSIEAALYPDDTTYYYYRAKASGNGEHYFSKTLNEHNNYSGK